MRPRPAPPSPPRRRPHLIDHDDRRPPPLLAAIAAGAHLLQGAANDYDGLLDLIGDARFVLLGEATHGTHEFYEQRALITQRLIAEKGFTAVAVEADWPDAYRVNRYVRAEGDDRDAVGALGGFKRFPSWMWRNADVVNFVDWLRAWNDARPHAARTGFYGLDLYSLFTSMEEVLRYLDKVDPAAAADARQRYACFDHYGDDSQQYAYAAGIGHSESCQREVIAQLQTMQQRAAEYMRHDGIAASDAFFYAQQNARLVKNAEEYYRTMFRGRVSSWNLRDRHMSETLDALAVHLGETRDAAAQDRRVGTQLARRRRARHRNRPARRMERRRAVAPALRRRRLPGRLFHLRRLGHRGVRLGRAGRAQAGAPGPARQLRRRVPPDRPRQLHAAAAARQRGAPRRCSNGRLERAIGVLYLPRTERQSHYFSAQLPQQFDAVIHFDTTGAVQPLEPTSHWDTGEAPETYPIGL